jgi:hypothetical protein
MITIQINASQVIEIEELEKNQARAGIWFLNWKIKEKKIFFRKNNKKESYEGAGIYAISFNNNLIYIGSYLGQNLDKNINKAASASGDVAKDRWWKHIETMTARGHKLHTARGNLSTLQKELGNQHVMIDGFNCGEPSILHKSAGADAALRRLRFAAKNSSLFHNKNTTPEDVLKHFDFVYIRFDNISNNTDSEILKKIIDKTEKKLIKQLAPLCNTKHVPPGKEAILLSTKDVAQLIEEELFLATKRLQEELSK